MPITLRALARDRHTLRIDYGEDGDLNVTYAPSRITEKLIAQMSDVHDDTDVAEWRTSSTPRSRRLSLPGTCWTTTASRCPSRPMCWPTSLSRCGSTCSHASWMICAWGNERDTITEALTKAILTGKEFFLRQAGLDGVPDWYTELELAAEYHVAPDWFLQQPPIWRDWALTRLQIRREVARQQAEHDR